MNKRPNGESRSLRSRLKYDRNVPQNDRVRPLDRKPTLDQFFGPSALDKIPLEPLEQSERITESENRGASRRFTRQSSSQRKHMGSSSENGGRPRRYFMQQSSGDQELSRDLHQRLGYHTSKTQQAEISENGVSHQQQENVRKCLWSFDSGSPGNEHDHGKPVVLTEAQLARRQKDIDYGKNTLGYKQYLDEVPVKERKKFDPKTPNKRQPCSRRFWDNQVRRWRRDLHRFDPPSAGGVSDGHSPTTGSSPPSSILSTSPSSSALETASDTGYDTVQDFSQPQEDEQEDETIQGFRIGRVKTWEEMMLEEEEEMASNSLQDGVDHFCVDDALGEENDFDLL